MTLLSTFAGLIPPKVFCAVVAHAHRRFEPELREVVARCDPHGTAVDVGAWFGPWSHWLARRVDQVVAFEANPDVAAILRATVAPNVVVHEIAVSDQSAEVELSITGGGLGSEGRSSLRPLDDATRTVRVHSAPLDSFGLRDVRFLKIDVEGHELAVLEGARELLERWHPVVLVELEARHGDIAPSIELLQRGGYTGHIRRPTGWQPLDAARLASEQRAHSPRAAGGYLRGVLRPSSYPNNVLFVHPASTWSPLRVTTSRR